MSAKTVSVPLTPRERYAIYAHFTGNVSCQTGREQDEYDDLWTSFDFDEIDLFVQLLGHSATPGDFSKESEKVVELTKEEVGYLVKFCTRPIQGALSRLVRPVRVKFEEARDKAGLKAVPAE